MNNLFNTSEATMLNQARPLNPIERLSIMHSEIETEKEIKKFLGNLPSSAFSTDNVLINELKPILKIIAAWSENKSNAIVSTIARILNRENLIYPLQREIDDIRKQKKFVNASDNAHNPMPLQREIPVSQEFPISTLPTTCKKSVEALSESIQAPRELIAQSLLASIHLAVQGQRNVEIDGRIHPLCQFFLTIGESGERKTTVDKIALDSIRNHENEQFDLYKQSLSLHQQELQVWETQKKQILNNKKSSADEKKNQLEQLGDKPTSPRIPLMLSEEPTMAALQKTLINGHPSLGIFLNEGARLLGGFSMREESKLDSFSLLSQLWDAANIKRERSSEGVSLITGRRLSMHLMLQHHIASSLLNDELAQNQGFLSRFLISWPTSTVGSRFYKPTNLLEDNRILAFHSRISELLKLKLPIQDSTTGELSPTSITLTHEAKSMWIALYDEIEKNSAVGKELDDMRAFSNKMPEHALRLAAALTLFIDHNAGKIKPQEMETAVNLISYYLGEARRLQLAANSSVYMQNPKKLLQWIYNKHRHKTSIQTSEVYRGGPDSIRNVRDAKKALRVLEEYNWLYQTPDDDKTWHFHKKFKDAFETLNKEG